MNHKVQNKVLDEMQIFRSNKQNYSYNHNWKEKRQTTTKSISRNYW